MTSKEIILIAVLAAAAGQAGSCGPSTIFNNWCFERAQDLSRLSANSLRE